MYHPSRTHSHPRASPMPPNPYNTSQQANNRPVHGYHPPHQPPSGPGNVHQGHQRSYGGNSRMLMSSYALDVSQYFKSDHPEGNGTAIIIGPGGVNHKYLQQYTGLKFTVRKPQGGQPALGPLIIDVKYNNMLDIAALEVVVARLAEAYRRERTIVAIKDADHLPHLDPQLERQIRDKWDQRAAANDPNAPVVPAHPAYPPMPNPVQHQPLHVVSHRADVEAFYVGLPFPSMVPLDVMVELRYALIPVVDGQRRQQPATHAEFLFNVHVLAVITHGLLSFKNFAQHYLTVFRYEVTPNVTLIKLLKRYPSLVSFVEMGDVEDKGIKAEVPNAATKDVVYQTIAKDDWNDPKCPSHIQSHWLTPELCRFLPGSPYAPPPIESWGTHGVGNNSTIGSPGVRPPWTYSPGGSLVHAPPPTPPLLGLNEMAQAPELTPCPPGQIPLRDVEQVEKVMDDIMAHPVALVIQTMHHLCGPGGPMNNAQDAYLSLDSLQLGCNDYIVPSGVGGILSYLEALDDRHPESGWSGHISTLLGKKGPYDDGGGLLPVGHRDLEQFIRTLPEIFEVTDGLPDTFRGVGVRHVAYPVPSLHFSEVVRDVLVKKGGFRRIQP